MKTLFRIFIAFILLLFNIVHAQDTVLQGFVSLVPNSFYGTWRVNSVLEDTDSVQIFKKSGIDLWNLSCKNDVIILTNLFNGAKADIKIDKVEDNNIVFMKTGKYGNKVLTDVVEISLDKNSFKGTDKLRLDTYVDGKIMKTETAKYILKGEKIAGDVY